MTVHSPFRNELWRERRRQNHQAWTCNKKVDKTHRIMKKTPIKEQRRKNAQLGIHLVSKNLKAASPF